jgi:hypothetical protein
VAGGGGDLGRVAGGGRPLGRAAAGRLAGGRGALERAPPSRALGLLSAMAPLDSFAKMLDFRPPRAGTWL